jgi:glycerol-3-phosphate acyltransferase PlsY
VLAAAPPAGLAALLVAGAYLLGTFPSAALAARRRGVDPTRAGSGNPGATNVLRTAGRRAAVVTLAADVAKGALAAGVGWVVGGHGLGVACGVAAVVGHVLPVTRRFRGGKGVATGAGMTLVLYPLALGLACLGFAAATGVSRTVSLGSIVAAALLPVGAALVGAPGREVAALSACAVLVVARHRDNIVRLAHGEERRIGAPG